ncbi:MAG: hypothetical protein JWR80_8100 [Bradyrhizobium sp.]|nr:hypothetical protein [Bradyrhizobium sp.]
MARAGRAVRKTPPENSHGRNPDMVMFSILGREIEVAPYKLEALTAAAPFIDGLLASTESMKTLQGVMGGTGDFVRALSIGLQKVDPVFTPEYLAAQLDFTDITRLQAPFRELLQASGLALELPAKKPGAKAK